MMNITYVQSMIGMDIRSMALFRIGIALVVLYDLYDRMYEINEHYTDYGVWPRSLAMIIQDSHIWSIHLFSGEWLAQYVLFGIHMICCVLFMIGYNTRMMCMIVWTLCVSLHSRTEMVNNFGDQLLRCVLFWSIFLPLGATWSYDAWHRLRRKSPSSVRLNGSCIRVSLATACFHLQMSCVYLFTAILKSDPEWRGGNGDSSAIYYALNVDYYVTSIGVMMRHHLSPQIMNSLTLAVLCFECIAPFGLLLPWLRGKMVTVLLLWMMHMGLALCFHLGIFTNIYMVLFVIFMPPTFWDRLFLKVQRQRCGNNRVTYRVEARTGPVAEYVKELVVFRVWPHSMVGEIVSHDRELDKKDEIPVILRVIGDDGSVLTNRTAWRFLHGWNVPDAWLHALAHTTQSHVVSYVHRVVRVCRGALLVLMLWYMLASNVMSATTNAVAWLPPTVKTIGDSLRLRQDWSMFAPGPPRDDGWYVFVGINHQGTAIDVFRNTTSVMWKKPSDVHLSYRSTRWMAYMINVWTLMSMEPALPHQRKIMDAFSLYFCRLHNDMVYEIRIHFMREHTMPYGQEPRLENWKLWAYVCDTEY